MKMFLMLAACGGVILVTGCSQETATSSSSTTDSSLRIDGTQFLLDKKPSGAADVLTVRADARDGEDVILTGRIGGSSNPWVEGRAAFSIVDDSLRTCSDIPGDQCAKPWDYCCETDKLATSTTLIQIVDEAGSLVKTDARTLLNVKELSTVTVTGKARRDDAGNLTVLASGVYVKQN